MQENFKFWIFLTRKQSCDKQGSDSTYGFEGSDAS